MSEAKCRTLAAFASVEQSALDSPASAVHSRNSSRSLSLVSEIQPYLQLAIICEAGGKACVCIVHGNSSAVARLGGAGGRGRAGKKQTDAAEATYY